MLVQQLQPASSATTGSQTNYSFSPQPRDKPANKSNQHIISKPANNADSNRKSPQRTQSFSHPPPSLLSLNTRPPPPTTPQSPPAYHQPRQYNHQPRVNVTGVGASNLGRITSALRNTIPNVKIQSTPGATFDHMAGDIMRSQPCDILFIAGGVNDADSLDDVELARAPLRKAIYQAKLKAKKVIVMSPPALDLTSCTYLTLWPGKPMMPRLNLLMQVNTIRTID